MNPRTTGILYLLAAALGAFVWFWQVRGADERKTAEEQAKRLFPELAAEDLRWIEFTSSDGKDVRLEFGEGGWRIVRPLDFPADESAMSGLTSNLSELASETGLIVSHETPSAPSFASSAPIRHSRDESAIWHSTFSATGTSIANVPSPAEAAFATRSGFDS